MHCIWFYSRTLFFIFVVIRLYSGSKLDSFVMNGSILEIWDTYKQLCNRVLWPFLLSSKSKVSFLTFTCLNKVVSSSGVLIEVLVSFIKSDCFWNLTWIGSKRYKLGESGPVLFLGLFANIVVIDSRFAPFLRFCRVGSWWWGTFLRF